MLAVTYKSGKISKMVHFDSLLQFPDHGLSRLSDRLLLFRHDYSCSNVLQLVNSTVDIVDETLVEIVMTCELSSVPLCLTCRMSTVIIVLYLLLFTSSYIATCCP